MSRQFVNYTANEDDEFNVNFKTTSDKFRQNLVVPHCYAGEKVEELKEQVMKYGLEPGMCFDVKDASDEAVEQVTETCNLKLVPRANDDATTAIQIICSSASRSKRIYSTFQVYANVAELNFVEFATRLLGLINPSTLLDPTYSGSLYTKVKGVWIDTADKKKMLLKRFFPGLPEAEHSGEVVVDAEYMDPDHFTDYYLNDAKYLAQRPLLVIETNSTIDDLLVLHLHNRVIETDFWSTLGINISIFDSRTLAQLFTSTDPEQLYYLPAVMALLVNQWVVHTDPALNDIELSDDIQTAREGSTIANAIAHNEVISQIFSCFVQSYASLLRRVHNLDINSIYSIFGVNDGVYQHSAKCTNFFKAIMLEAYRNYAADLYHRIDYREFVPDNYHFYGASEAKLRFIRANITYPRGTSSRRILIPLRDDDNIFCPISLKRVSKVRINHITGSGLSRPVFVTVYNNLGGVLSRIWLKKSESPEFLYKEYSVSIGIRMVNNIWKKTKNLTYNGSAVKCATYRVASMDQTFGAVESAGFDTNQKDIFTLGTYYGELHHQIRDGVLTPVDVPNAWVRSVNDDSFNERLMITGIGCAAACTKLRIGDRHKNNTLIRSNGDVFPIDFGDTWTPRAMFCVNFLRPDDRYTAQWNYDQMYRLFLDIFERIDMERERMYQNDDTSTTRKNYLASYRALYKKAFETINDDKLQTITDLLNILSPENPKPLYVNRLDAAKKFYIGGANIKTLYDQFEAAMNISINSTDLPNTVARFKNFDFSALNF